MRAPSQHKSLDRRDCYSQFACRAPLTCGLSATSAYLSCLLDFLYLLGLHCVCCMSFIISTQMRTMTLVPHEPRWLPTGCSGKS